MNKMHGLVRQMQRAVNTQANKAMPTAYDTSAIVRRIEGNTAWVHFDGGVDETPVELTIAASVGDTVQVRVSGGSAWIQGNKTAPPTDDTTANAARSVANKAQATAQAAEQTAREAMSKISGDSNQYAWHTETGTDTGTHITEVPKEDFIADPENGGGNSVFRSNGMAIRDGLTELATFGADHAQIGQSDSSNVYISPAGGIDFYGEQGVKIGSIGRTTAVQRTLTVDDSWPYDPSSPSDYYYGQCNIDEVPLNNEITITASVTRYRQSESRPITATIQYTDGGYEYTFLNGGGGDFGATLTIIVDATNGGYVGFQFQDTSGADNLVAATATVTYTNLYIPTRCLFGGELANPDYGDYSVSMNYSRAAGDYQTTAGKFNEIDDESKYAFIIGNGTKDTYAERNNAFTVDWDGNTDQQGRATTEDMTVAEVSDFINGLDFSAATLVDFIVEQGEGYGANNVKGYYRKWNSGKCEFWYDWSAASGMTTAVWAAPIYFVDTSAFSTVWNGLFTAKPTNLQISSTNSQLINVYAWDYDVQGINKLRLLTCNGKTGAAYSFSLYAVGTWK